MKRLIVFIIFVFVLGCEKNVMNFYEVDFYGNNVKIPEFLIYNKEAEKWKYYCKNNLYFKDSTETIIFDVSLCEYKQKGNLDYDFEHLKRTLEATREQIQEEIPEMEIISIKSTNKGNFFLFENVYNLNNKYIKKVYIALEYHFIYIYYETKIENIEVIKQLDELVKEFEKERIIKNIVLPENTDICYCGGVLFSW